MIREVVALALVAQQLLGIQDGKLVRVDSETLRPLPGASILVGSGGCAPRLGGRACWTNAPWTVSPDRARLAVARNDASSLRLVDVRRTRVVADVRLDGGAVGALAWLSPGRLLAVQETNWERQRLVAVDLARRKVAVRRALGGSVVQLTRTPRELVMLLAPAQAISPARIAVADPRGTVRFVRLGKIAAGSKVLGTGSNHRVDSRVPGLAVDPQGRRAFVLSQSLAAEVDLGTLAVSYHPLGPPRSLLARAKQTNGYARTARWLGGDRLAVSGADSDESAARPAGLLLVDTRTWSVRTIEPRAFGFRVADNLLLWTGDGLAAYGLDGEQRFHLFDGSVTWVAQVHGGRAYVGISGQDGVLRIVDLADGRVVGERRAPLPWLVQGIASGWWES